MEISFNRSEYGRELEIQGIRYTNYDGYGDKTEVFVGFVDERGFDYPKLEKFVLDGHLSVDRIIDKLLHEEDVYSYFEDNEETIYYVDSSKLNQCFDNEAETSYNAKRESRLLK